MIYKKKYLSVILIIFIISFLSCSRKKGLNNFISFSGYTMGTFYNIEIVYHRNSKEFDSELKIKKIKQDISDLLLKINHQMSVFEPDSELSCFNSYNKVDWFTVSLDLAEVIAQSIDVSKKSNGAFDVTVAPIVNLWGFGPKKSEYKIPTDQTIKELKKYVGYKKISVRFSPPSVKKKMPEIFCDLSGIAKGFAVDRVAKYFDSIDIINYLVEIGGEIKVRGKNKDGDLWQIGVATPTNKPGIQKIIFLKNKSMATSGDYRNYFEQNGIRYSHTIDPRAGKPISHKLASVTVIHNSCMYADAMATAIDVLGPDKGYDLAVRENLPVFLIIRGKHGFTEKVSPEFEKILLVKK